MVDEALKVTQLDFQQHPALNFLPEARPTPPVDPVVGQLWESSITHTLSKFGVDDEWHQIITDDALAQALDDFVLPVGTYLLEANETLPPLLTPVNTIIYRKV